jgi:hypothetical protein
VAIVTERTYRWEHGGKGRKRATSLVTGTAYVWSGETGEVRAEVGKGNWQSCGVAGDLDEADRVASECDALVGAKQYAFRAEMEAAQAVVASNQVSADAFRKIVLGSESTKRLYRHFCRLREMGHSWPSIAGHMEKWPQDAALEFVELLEIFRQQGRRV